MVSGNLSNISRGGTDAGNGIDVVSGGALIAGNIVGLDANGNTAIGNANFGIVSSGNRIGGPSASSRNVVSGNLGGGILAGTDSIIVGNFVGTDITGSLARGNIGNGITIRSQNVRVGGQSSNEGNLISGNSLSGILLTSAAATFNVLEGNLLGTDVSGAFEVAGQQFGIQVADGASRNAIGSLAAPNVIGYSAIAGIQLEQATESNEITGNFIGVNLNSILIPNQVGVIVLNTSGENNFEDNIVRASLDNNFSIASPNIILRRNTTTGSGGSPIDLTSVSPGLVNITQVVTGRQATVIGEVQARPNTTYAIDLFTSTSGTQAERFVAATTVDTDVNGFATFQVTPSQPILNGNVSATITGPNNQLLVNTSELFGGVRATPAVILGLRSQSPEGTPITLTAFASSNPVSGYLWEVRRDGQPYAFDLKPDGTQSDGGIQFSPDDEGEYSVGLLVTLTDGTQSQIGPFAISVYNEAPTPSFEITTPAPIVGESIILTSNNSDPGQADTLRSSWEVRYGAPNGPIVHSLANSEDRTTAFTPTSGGVYFASMTVADLDGAVRTLSRQIEVAGLAVVSTITLANTSAREGQPVRASAPESELNRTEQLDFQWSVFKVSSGIAYPFTVPSKGVVEFIPDDNGDYRIGLKISDGTTISTAADRTITVSNADPRVNVIGGSATVLPGSVISLNAQVDDPGKADTHQIAWTVSHNQQPLGLTGTGTDFSFTPSSAGFYIVSALVTDDDGGSTETRRAFSIAIEPVTIEIRPPAGTDQNTTFVEGNTVTFASEVAQPVSSYSWKAKRSNGEVLLSVTNNQPSFSFAPPQGGEYLIELEAILSDGRKGSATFGPMLVAGSAPVIQPLTILSPTLDRLLEGTPVTIRGLATDAFESIGLNYQWQIKRPGANEFVDANPIDGAPRDFRFTPSDNGTYEVRLTVSDSQGLTSTFVMPVIVSNAAPSVRLDTIYDSSRPNLIQFNAIASDPGIDDIADLRYAWSIDGGQTYTPASNSPTFETSLANLGRVSVLILDGDSGSANVEYYVLQSQSNDFVINPTVESQAGNADEILYLALDGDDRVIVTAGVNKRVVVYGGSGNDFLDASAATASVTLVGGDGNDTLIGGIGDDLLIAGAGNNTLVGGNGNNRFIGGGNDTMTGGIHSDYYEVHFSTVVLNDAAGLDTVDLTASPAGVKLNLSNNTGAAQPVFAGSTLAINGVFERLIGSNFNDELSTSTANTSIHGGLGNDTLVANTVGVELVGGHGDDTLTLQAAAGVFTSGEGNDLIAGTLSISQTSQIATGDGDDRVNISSASNSTAAPITLSLGNGNNTLTANRVTGKIYGESGKNDGVEAFGVAAAATSRITVTSSTNIGIFGSTRTGSSVAVSASSNVGIFGTGQIDLNNISGGTVTSTLFGGTVSLPTSISVSSSTNVGIFGSTLASAPTLNLISNNSSNVRIFGSSNPAGSVRILGGSNIGIFGIAGGEVSLTNVLGSNNVIEASAFGVRGLPSPPMTVNVSSSTNVGIFGAVRTAGPSLRASLTNSTNVGIFGVSSQANVVTVLGGTNVGIFGLLDGDVSLSNVTGATVEASQFGSALSSNATVRVTATGSTNVGIFGAISSKGPALSATVSHSSNVGIFGPSRSGLASVTVNNSTSVGIFGSSVSTGSTLQASVNSSTNVSIFGSSNPAGDSVKVVGGVNVGIYGLVAGEASLESVETLNVHSSEFGSAAGKAIIVSVSSSQNVGIFGATATTGPRLNAMVNTSTNVGIFGSALRGHVQVSGSSNVGIFGSTKTGTSIEVKASQNIGIYSGYDDEVTLEDVEDARVEGGVFGSVAGGKGITVTVRSGSSNIGIFGTSLDDMVVLSNSVEIESNLRQGNDTVEIDGGSQLFVIGDDGEDRINYFGGSDTLIYLGTGNDLAEILGGENVRVIGEGGADEMAIKGGQNIQLDGGDDDDRILVTGGSDVLVRTDNGSDALAAFGGIGLSAQGGDGNDLMQVFGSIGGALQDGKVYASIDGQSGDDTLEVRPLSNSTAVNSVAAFSPLSRFNDWLDIPAAILTPVHSTTSSSVALVGGLGDDSLWLEGSHRLYGLGSDGNDSIKLIAGNASEVSGGDGADIVEVRATGSDNRVFGDQGDDRIEAYAGDRLAVFGEEGADTIRLLGGTFSFSRGGLGADVLEIYAGENLSVVGENDADQMAIYGGFGGVAAGSLGDDKLTILGGHQGILLGQSGNDVIQVLGGTRSILSGGDGDDQLESNSRGDDLYGDDGDDNYRLKPASNNLASSDPVRLRELIFIDPSDFEPLARGSDTIDLSEFTVGAILDLSMVGLFSSSTVGLQSVIPGQLQLILLGSIENIIGTSGNDVLTGSSESNRLVGGGGHDSLLGLDGDDVLEGGIGDDSMLGGNGDDTYRMATTVSQSLGVDEIVEATDAGIDLLDFEGMPVGLGTLDLAVATPQRIAGGLQRISLTRAPASPSVAAIEQVKGTNFADTILGNELDNRFDSLKGNDILDGRSGSDIYVFRGRELGVDRINESAVATGRDTLDFSGLDAPLNLDLASTAIQSQIEMSISFASGNAIENVIGTSFSDVISGNGLDNSLFGNGGSDRLAGRNGSDRLVGDLPVVVLLDFDSAYRSDRGDYAYSSLERDRIEQNLWTKYAAFNWQFTQSESFANLLTKDMGRSYVRLAFSQGRGGGVSGDAGEVDFRNIDRSVVSEVNINALLPTLHEMLIERYGLTYSSQQLSDMVVSLTSTIAAHELAHTAGLRHADAFGPIGSGVYEHTDLTEIYPAYAGPLNAVETRHHIIASPASVGTTIEDAITSTYFGEREAIKLAFNESGDTRREAGAGFLQHGTPEQAEHLGALSQLYVPNTLPATGAHNSGRVFDVSATAIIGDLKFDGNVTESDFYRFSGRAGEWVNVELMAAGIRPLRGPAFDGQLRIFRADGSLLAINDDEMEGTKDATLQDILLPYDGDYLVEVSRSPQPALASQGGRYELFISRFNALPASSLLPSARGDTLIGGAGADSIHGSSGDDMILATDSAIRDLADELYGYGGTDTVDSQSVKYNYLLPSNHSIERFINFPSLAIEVPSAGVAGQTLPFILHGLSLTSGLTYRINWGDGTASNVAATNGATTVLHAYAAASSNAPYRISVDVVNAEGILFTSAQVNMTITQTAIVSEGGQRVLYSSGSSVAEAITVRRIDANSFGIKLSATGSERVYNIGSTDAGIDRIAIFGLAGNDTINIDPSLTLPMFIDGGVGNDVIRGGGGNDILLGGEGVDQLYGNGGMDILIGGRGKDKLYAQGDGDILIAGWTQYDGNTAALIEIRNFWASLPQDNSLQGYQNRVATLQNVGTANGYRLNANTVRDDVELDVLNGAFSMPLGSQRGRNLYFSKVAGKNLDSVLNKTSDEQNINTPNT